ncbi:MAG: hypothetical protein NVS4B8_01800 [Herpetosiphon sp.]
MLSAFTVLLGLDHVARDGALLHHDFVQSMLAGTSEAKALGVSGVPGFIGEGTAMLSGVQSLLNLQKLVGCVQLQSKLRRRS